MKTKLALSFSFLLAYGMIVYSQVSLIEGELYKNAKLQTLSGTTFNADIIVKGDSINIKRKDFNIESSESLQKINKIEIPTKPDFDTYQKNILKGTSIGFGVGIVTTVIATYLYQRPREGTKTFEKGIPWHCSEITCEPSECDYNEEIIYDNTTHQVEYTKVSVDGEYRMKLAIGPKIIMLGIPTAIGFLSGITKKELKTVYIKDSNSLNRIDYDIYYDPYRKNMSFNLCYKF